MMRLRTSLAVIVMCVQTANAEPDRPVVTEVGDRFGMGATTFGQSADDVMVGIETSAKLGVAKLPPAWHPQRPKRSSR